MGIETFPSSDAPSARLDLQPLWQWRSAEGGAVPALGEAWGWRHRPDWARRGLIVWPRGGQSRVLRLRLRCPGGWRERLDPAAARARLVLCWWAERAEVRVDGQAVRRGDLFDTRCRWELPPHWWSGEPLDLELRLRSPRHDDGALLHSRIELEPTDAADPHGLLAATIGELRALRRERGRGEDRGEGVVRVLGHAHLDLAWLWPVADTWRAAERTFKSVLGLMERYPELRFGHSTPALYAWLERQRPSLFRRIRRAMRDGRWEPLNGPWVECDCVLISTASLLRQFQEGQRYSLAAFPEWPADVAWLPDSFGFGAGLPAVAAGTGVRWFCTHKLAWNATNPFPHRLFRWRSRCGAELLALMTAPIGTDGDPLAIERFRLEWRSGSGHPDVLWLPGVGDHGGGPTAEMLDQLALWQRREETAALAHGTLRSYLQGLETLAPRLPVWRDELYLELHRGCATSRPDQKRHNRSLERLLREADLAVALLGSPRAERPDWCPLLFQQFHDILPGTSIPEVFEQAEPQWRAARRDAARLRDGVLLQGLGRSSGDPEEGPAPMRPDSMRPDGIPCRPGDGQTGAGEGIWWAVQLQPLPATPRTVRLGPGRWWLDGPEGEMELPTQTAPGGGQWLQLPGIEGIDLLRLRRSAATAPSIGHAPPAPLVHPVRLEREPALGPGRWRLSNGRITAVIGPAGVEQLLDGSGCPQLAAPLAWCRWRDRGEYWDAWDIPADYRDHPLPWTWDGSPTWVERGPLCGRFVWWGQCGGSRVRVDGRLLAGNPWLELVVGVDWRQRHELLRLECPLARPAVRWAADTSGGVIERPARAHTDRERQRWEVPVVSWVAAVAAADDGGDGLAVLLDGPQGVSVTPGRLGISLLRSPTWPDPGADNGWQRQRLALMPASGGWRRAEVPGQAQRLREPLWIRPAAVGSQRPCRPPGDGGFWLRFPALEADLRLVAMRRADDGGPDVVIAIQNEGPCRRHLRLADPWTVVRRLNGLEAAGIPTGVASQAPAGLLLRPWELGFWRLRR